MSSSPKDQIINAARTLLEPLVESQQMELYDIEFLTEYGRKILRLYIEKEGGITLNDCERVNNLIVPALDANDPISEAYVLEVSSPGIERKLVKDSHYLGNIGKLVEVRLNKPLEKRKKFRGILLALEDESIVLSNETSVKELVEESVNETEEFIKLPREHLAYCRLVYTEERNHG